MAVEQVFGRHQAGVVSRLLIAHVLLGQLARDARAGVRAVIAVDPNPSPLFSSVREK
ncbi:MAG: hypothetical protein ACM3TN_09690 [Alphaproteobacteria bacterium]